MSETEIQYSLTVNTEMTYSEVRKLETVIVRVLGYIKEMSGGNPDLIKAIEVIQRTILALRSLQLAIRAVQLSSGPIGWIYAGTTIIAAGISGYSIIDEITGR